jgi:hypothetical protein
MPRRLPSSALDTQSQITAVSGSLASPQGTLSGYWKLDQTLTGDITGNAGTATRFKDAVVVNGTTLAGNSTPVTIGVNTTSIATSGTYYPTFVPTNTAGNQQASTHASLSYDPNTGFLSATRFVGSGAGLTGVVTSISFNGAAAVNGAVSITSPAQVQPDWNATTGLGSILNKPALFSGSYTDLSNKPALFSGSYTDLSSKPTLFDGAYSSLTGIPAAPVTSVNASTGAVIVRSVYNPRTTLYMIPEQTMHNPSAFGSLQSGYVGDYWSSSGFSLTGMTVTNFQSSYSTDDGGAILGYYVNFGLEFRQAFFDAYAPGYTPNDLRSVNVTMEGPGNYGVSWIGQPSTSNWITNGHNGTAITYTMSPNLSATVARTTIAFSSTEVIPVNNRYSPPAWPAFLYLKFYVAD